MSPVTLWTAAFLFTATLAEMVYYLQFFRQALPSGLDPEPMPESNLPAVTVLVCFRDELENLRKLIPALLEQDYPEFELILVADRANEKILEEIRNISSQNSRIKLLEISEVPSGISPKKFALQQGIHAAINPVILLTDADCLPAGRHWIHTMARQYDSQTDVVLGFGAYRQADGMLNQMIQYDTQLNAAQYLGFARAPS